MLYIFWIMQTITKYLVAISYVTLKFKVLVLFSKNLWTLHPLRPGHHLWTTPFKLWWSIGKKGPNVPLFSEENVKKQVFTSKSHFFSFFHLQESIPTIFLFSLFFFIFAVKLDCFIIKQKNCTYYETENILCKFLRDCLDW